MPVITRLELENAQRDVTDIGNVINGAADRPNPPQIAGTVTTRTGRVIKTISKLVVEGQATVEARLTPKIYSSTIERTAALTLTGDDELKVGQTCYDKEDTQLYIMVIEPVGDPTPVDTKVWRRVSNLEIAAQASLDQLLVGVGDAGRLSVSNRAFMKEREKLFDDNALDVHHISFPIKNVLNDGLLKALGFTGPDIPIQHKQVGVDFGCRFTIPELFNVETTPFGVDNPYEFMTSPRRLFVRNNNPNSMYKLYIPAYVDISSGYLKTTYIKDCYIDCNYGAYDGIGKYNDIIYPVYIEHCTIRRFINHAAAPNKGHIVNCDIELSQADGLKASGSDIYIHGNMMRLLGQDIPSTHADCIQIWDCTNLYITGNTLYMPGTDTEYDEGTYGTTQCIRLVTESNGGVLANFYVMGNVMIGGGFSVAVRSRYAGSLVQNGVIANNLLGGSIDGDKLYVYGPVAKDHWLSNNPGTIRNLILWNNKMTDGTGFNAEAPPVAQAGSNQNGIWHYDKDYATAEFMEIGKRFGLLDWNGDLADGVVNRSDE